MDKNANIFLSMVNRRAVGEPTSYIVRSRSFWKDDFYIEETVLDPRPESEMIIEFTRKQLFDGMKVLDLGCGSGCIGLSIHRENPEISLSLSDLSNKALSVAKKKIETSLKSESKPIVSFDTSFATIQSQFFSSSFLVYKGRPRSAYSDTNVFGYDIMEILLIKIYRRFDRVSYRARAKHY